MTRRTAHDAAQHVLDLIAGEAERAEKLETENRKLKQLVSERDKRISELEIHIANLIAAAKGCWHVQARMAKKRAIECMRAA